MQGVFDKITCGIILQLPGVQFDVSETDSVHFGQFADWFSDWDKFLFIYPRRCFKRIRTAAHIFRIVLARPEFTDYKTNEEWAKILRVFELTPHWRNNPFHRQVWRLQDLRDGGGLGFIVELFFLALKQLLLKSSSKESHSALYIRTFRAITSDWRKYKRSPGTQQLLLDMVEPHRGIIFSFDFPAYIIDEFLAFLGNVLEGETGQLEHIDEVVRDLIDFRDYSPKLSVKVLAVIGTQASSS